MNICIVKIGSYLPGGGIEEYSRLISHESTKLGHSVDVFSVAIGETFKRPKHKKLLNGLKYVEYNISHIDEFRNDINGYDVMILMNGYVTTLGDIRTQDKKEEILNECYKFFECYRDVNCYKILQNHYGPEKYTVCTPYMIDYILASDKVMGHSENDRFYELTKTLGVPFEKIQLFIDFDDFEKTTNKNKKMKYVGRGSSLKGYQHIPKIADRLYDAGIRIDMHGMTRDMSVYQNLIRLENTCYLGKPNSDKTTIYAWGLYSKDEISDILSDAMFVFAPTKFKQGEYNNRFEIAQLEAIAHGCVLILHKLHGENCYMPDGKRWIDVPEFAIWFDDKDMQPCVDKIIELLNNKELRNKYVENCYNYAKSIYDVKAFEKHFNKMIKREEIKENKLNEEMLKAYNIHKHNEVVNCLDLLDNRVTKRIKQKFFDI